MTPTATDGQRAIMSARLVTATTSVLALALALLLLSSCAPESGEPMSPQSGEPPAITALAADKTIEGQQVDLEARVIFWLGNPSLDPGGEGWRSEGEAAAQLLTRIFGDIHRATILRQGAIRALGNFDQPWVQEFLFEVLLDRDRPDAVRIEAAEAVLALAIRGGAFAESIKKIAIVLGDQRESDGLRLAVVSTLAHLPDPAARTALVQSKSQDNTGLLADRIDTAIQLFDEEEALRAIARQVEFQIKAIDAEFVPAIGDARKVGVPGPDHLGVWKNGQILISIKSSLEHAAEFTVDFDPNQRGLVFTDQATDQNSPSQLKLKVEPGQRATIARSVAITGVDVATEVFVFIEGYASPAARLAARIKAEPAK